MLNQLEIGLKTRVNLYESPSQSANRTVYKPELTAQILLGWLRNRLIKRSKMKKKTDAQVLSILKKVKRQGKLLRKESGCQVGGCQIIMSIVINQ